MCIFEMISLLEVRALETLQVAGLSIRNLGDGIGCGNRVLRLLILNDANLETRGILGQHLLTMEAVEVVFGLYVKTRKKDDDSLG